MGKGSASLKNSETSRLGGQGAREDARWGWRQQALRPRAFAGQGKDFEFCPKRNQEPSKGFKQGSDMFVYLCFKTHILYFVKCKIKVCISKNKIRPIWQTPIPFSWTKIHGILVNIFPNLIHQCRKIEKKEFYAEPENLRKFQRQKTSRIRDRNHKSGCDHKWQQKQNKANWKN